MRIFEIESSNEIFAKFNNFNMDISKRYQTILGIITMLLRNNNPGINIQYVDLINDYIVFLRYTILLQFPEEDDVDVITMKGQAQQYIVDITNEMGKLK